MQPTQVTGRKNPDLAVNLLPLLGFAPGGVYHAIPVASHAVCFYHAFSPLLAFINKLASGLFSAALSLRSPSPVVNWHRFSVEPGLSSIYDADHVNSDHLAI